MMHNLLVGKTFPEYNERFREICTNDEKFNLVDILENGLGLVEFIKVNKIDVLILDLILHGQDGFFVLDELNLLPKKPLIIIYTPLTSSYVVRRALTSGADYYYYDSVDVSYVLKRARQALKAMHLSQHQNPVHIPHTVEDQVALALHAIGFYGNLKGYFYLRDAITACLDSEDLLQSLTKSLYIYIGEKYQTTVTSVEKAIRHSIDLYWQNEGDQNIRRIFPHYVSAKRPTNGEFIRLLVDYVSESNPKETSKSGKNLNRL